jgi:glutamate/tyrosine decarboxylase-like PLP-dependent enzyme
LPLWFALTLHGLDAFRDAIRVSIHLADAFADALDACPVASLVLRPELGVVLFRRDDWDAPEWKLWAERLLAEQIAFVAPSTYRGEAVGRVVFMHPSTPADLVADLVASLQP